MANAWFVDRGGVERGPFTSQQLKAMAVKGDVLHTDFVQRGCGIPPVWRLAGNLKILSSCFAIRQANEEIWYYLDDQGNRIGPVSLNNVKDLVGDDKLKHDDYIFKSNDLGSVVVLGTLIPPNGFDEYIWGYDLSSGLIQNSQNAIAILSSAFRVAESANVLFDKKNAHREFAFGVVHRYIDRLNMVQQLRRIAFDLNRNLEAIISDDPTIGMIDNLEEVAKSLKVDSPQDAEKIWTLLKRSGWPRASAL